MSVSETLRDALDSLTAHKLRAGLSMMELLQEGYVGTVTEQQKEYLQRIESRLTSLD